MASVTFAYPVINHENDALTDAVVTLDRRSKRLKAPYRPENSIAYITDSEI